MHRQNQQRTSGIQGALDHFYISVQSGNHFVRQIRYEVVNLLIVGTIATPHAGALHIVKAKTLGTRHQRMQQVFRLADVFSCLQIV